MKTIKTTPYIPEKIEVKDLGNNKAQVVAYPFETGFAITIAHPLRRLLLSSIVGYSPVAVKIEDATHEFDSIRGMLEDVTLFILNLKNIRFKIKDDSKEEVTVSYSFDGSDKKEVKGEDLNNDDIEVVTPNKHLATLNENAELNFSIIIKKGIGYIPSEDLRDIVPEGYISLDAFFTPVKKAVYEIENVLVEDNPNFEKIVFDIQTDGLVSAAEAFKNALKVFNEQLSVFNELMGVEINISKEDSSQLSELSELLQPIDKLDLSARSYNSLDRNGIKYIAEIALMREKDLRLVKNLGEKSVEEIKNTMENMDYPVGYDFSEDAVKYLDSKIKEFKKD
jgi:DNA-directed RNA polymerase subunit alpha